MYKDRGGLGLRLLSATAGGDLIPSHRPFLLPGKYTEYSALRTEEGPERRLLSLCGHHVGTRPLTLNPKP